MGLPIQWLSHLQDRKEREEFEKVVRASTLTLSRLKTILLDKLDQIDTQEISADNFEKPEFSHRQAFYLGQRKATLDLLRLLGFLNDG